MEWRKITSSHGGFCIIRGIAHKGGVQIPGILGFTSPCFFQYDFSHYDTEAEALRAMKWKKDDHLAHGGSWAVSDDYGIMHCEKCGSELLCNDSGDMPEYFPQCGRQIDWASFDF